MWRVWSARVAARTSRACLTSEYGPYLHSSMHDGRLQGLEVTKIKKNKKNVKVSYTIDGLDVQAADE